MNIDHQPLQFSAPASNVRLPKDAATATAAVLAFARGDAEFIPSAEIATLQSRIDALRDPTAPDSLAELARQLPVLEALWLRFAAEAMAAKSTDHKAKLLRMALQAQQAYARTFVLVRGLRLQQQGGAAVSVVHGDGGF